MKTFAFYQDDLMDNAYGINFFLFFCDSLNILGDMKVFENDHLMGCKPRETALLSHRDASIPAQLFIKRGHKSWGTWAS